MFVRTGRPPPRPPTRVHVCVRTRATRFHGRERAQPIDFRAEALPEGGKTKLFFKMESMGGEAIFV